jgi:sulfatase maturation enzyme AslB (radical SAM superfamily)
MKNLRQEIREGKMPENCATCWIDEDNGKESKRQLYNGYAEWRYPDGIDYEAEPDMPRDYQLILGNACNLKCRTCNANYSSKWRKESIDRNIEFWEPPSKIDLHDLEQSKFWLDIEDWLPHVRVLEIMGGEPFYMKEFRKLIDKLVDMGVSKNIMITLSTNGTHYNDKLIDKIVGNFENLGFNISLDGVEEKFDYLRHGDNWDNVKSNLDKFYKLHTENDHVNINVTHTVSVWNFFYLRDFHLYFETNYPEFLIWNNLVHFPEWCEANVVPGLTKYVIADRVKHPEDFGLPAWDKEKYNKDISPLVEHALTDSTEEHWQKFLEQVNAGDVYRNESFEDTFTELYNIVKGDMISI